MMWTVVGRSLAACALAFPIALAVGSPGAHAQPGAICNPYLRQCADNAVVGAAVQGDTHITGSGIVQTIDCNNRTLLVNGGGNQITALGTCWAVTVQGNGNIVVADNVDQRRHGVRLGSDRPLQERRARHLGSRP